MEGAGALIVHGSHEESVARRDRYWGKTTDLFVAKGHAPREHYARRALGVAAAADRFNEKFRRNLWLFPLA